MAITAPPPQASPEPPPTAPTSRPRPLGRRRRLPGSRAVVGGLLVTLAALTTFVAHNAATAGPTATVVVATRAIAAGDRIAAADLRTVAVDLPGGVLDTLFVSPGDLDGAIALTPLDPDQAIARSAVRRGPTADAEPSHDLAFALDRDRALNGRIQPGERVDLVATFGAGAEARTEVVVRGVRVVALDAPTSASVATSAKVTITLAFVAEADVLRAANALEVAKVTLSRSAGPAPPDEEEPTVAGASSTPPRSSPTSSPTSSPSSGPTTSSSSTTVATTVVVTEPTATEPEPIVSVP